MDVSVLIKPASQIRITQMRIRVKSWLSSFLRSIRIRPSRANRRWLKSRSLKKKYARRLAAAGLAVAASASLISSTSSAQCDGPIFPGQTFEVGGDNPDSIASGDFNGDGLADVATANRFSDNVSVLLGNTVGTYALSLIHI